MPVTYSGTSGSGSSAGIWRAIVTINGVDRSAQVIGEIRVDADEGSARIADLTIRPADNAAFSIAAWVGKPVVIQIADYASGSAAAISTLFTGLIDTPALDLATRAISLRCTDNLQNIIEAMSVAAIDAAIVGGRDSPAIFDTAARGWSHAQDRLSTVPQSLDLSPAGVLRATDWAPKATPDLAFTTAHIGDGSVSVSLASRAQLVNQVDIDFGYRFPRVKAEGHYVAYSYVSETNLAQYVIDGNWFLQRSAVESAIKSAGATIMSITYTALPNYVVGPWVPGPYDAELCMGFAATVSFDYAQTIEEQFAITVSTPNSITAVGSLKDRLSGALEGDYTEIPAVETAMLLFANSISGIPPLNVATPSAGFTTASDVTLTADSGRAAANAAMEALIAIAKVRIWSAHRNNAISASVPLNPGIDLTQTIRVTAPTVDAQGKCRSLTHRMSTETGVAVTDFSMAICSIAGTGITHPETATAAPAGSTPAPVAIGDLPTVVFNGAAAGDHTITVTFPEVLAAERNLKVVPIAASYSATITEDLLTITL